MDEKQQIEKVLEEKVRPMLRSHGGDVCLLDCADGVVYVELRGACAGCPSADLDTKRFIAETLCAVIPQVRGVEVEKALPSDLLDFARKLLHGD